MLLFTGRTVKSNRDIVDKQIYRENEGGTNGIHRGFKKIYVL